MITWNAQAARLYGELGEQTHVPILHDALLPLIGDLEGRTLMDFGCGDGRLTIKLAQHGPGRVVCVDESAELLEIARREAEALPPHLARRFAFQDADEAVLPTSEKFDVVLCSLMLMMCDTRQRLERTMRGLIASLTSQGRLLVAVTHPCFRRAVHATFHNRLPEDFDYWQSGTPYDVVLDPKERQVAASLSDFHWRLDDYAHAIGQGGGVIRTMREVPGQYDTDGRPVGDPAYLVMVVSQGAKMQA